MENRKKASRVAFCGDKEILVLDFHLSQSVVIPVVNQIQADKQTDPNHNCAGHVLVVGMSPSGRYCAAVNDAKHVFVFDLESLDSPRRTSEFVIQRRAACVIFSVAEDVVLVADKSGDVYSMTLLEQKAPLDSQLLLGHVSMLTDIQMAPGGKLIATADRDEKIRLSRYPNCYNIYAYLLGHRSFVSRVAFSKSGRYLCSAGGDGVLILWDVVDTKRCAEFDLKEILRGDEVQEPVVNRLLLLDDDRLVVTVEDSASVLLLNVDFEKCSFSFTSKLDAAATIADCHLVEIESTTCLLLFTNDGALSLLDVKDCGKVKSVFLDSVSSQESVRLQFAQTQSMRFHTLKKCPVDKSGLEMYKERKEETQKNVMARRHRHKQKLSKRAKLAETSSPFSGEEVQV